MNTEKGTVDTHTQTVPTQQASTTNAINNNITQTANVVNDQKPLENNTESISNNKTDNNSSNNSVNNAGNNSNNKTDNKNNGNGKKKPKWRNRSHVLSPFHKFYTIAIKCYIEQLPLGWEKTQELIRESKGFLQDIQILAIRHYKDIYIEPNSLWVPSVEKDHFHILGRCKDNKLRYKVELFLQSLGIEFRHGIDDELWLNRAVESCGNFSAYATYLTHETADAILDGKERYELDEIVSNLTPDEVVRIREGYIRVADAYHKITPADLVAMNDTVSQLGHDLKSFDDWYYAQPFNVQSHAKLKTLRNNYNLALNKRLDAQDYEILRVCIYLKGLHGVGKTYGVRRAFDGKKVYVVKGNNTGKFDELRLDHDVLLLDDTHCGNLINMSDNYPCRVYRRNNNNPVWKGQFLVITSNDTFEDWLSDSGAKIYRGGTNARLYPPSQFHKAGTVPDYTFVNRNYSIYDTKLSSMTNDVGFQYNEVYYALLSRFFICEIVFDEVKQVNRLVCRKISTRGTYAEVKQRCELFGEFQRKFNEIIADYKPCSDDEYANLISQYVE